MINSLLKEFIEEDHQQMEMTSSTGTAATSFRRACNGRAMHVPSIKMASSTSDSTSSSQPTAQALEVGDHYLVQRSDQTWRKFKPWSKLLI